MKNLIIACAVFCSFTPFAQAQGPLLLIGNKSDDTLTFVDLATLKPVGTTSTGHHPHELAVTPSGRTAYVANYGAGDSLSVVDVRARKELRKIPLGPFRDPHGIQVGRDGLKVYATCETSEVVIEVDIATEMITRAFPTGQKVSHMLALAPDGKTLYTANIGSGSATAIDLARGTVVAQIPTGAGCEGIDVRPDGRAVWTANKDSDTISVIDAGTNRVVATLPCPKRPIRLKFTPDGQRALVSCAGSNALAVFDVPTRKEVRRIVTGSAPIGLVIEHSGRRAYVANTEANQVSVVDLATLDVTGTIRAGREPDGLALAGTK